jgi:hypothetical protein
MGHPAFVAGVAKTKVALGAVFPSFPQLLPSYRVSSSQTLREKEILPPSV